MATSPRNPADSTRLYGPLVAPIHKKDSRRFSTEVAASAPSLLAARKGFQGLAKGDSRGQGCQAGTTPPLHSPPGRDSPRPVKSVPVTCICGTPLLTLRQTLHMVWVGKAHKQGTASLGEARLPVPPEPIPVVTPPETRCSHSSRSPHTVPCSLEAPQAPA